MAVEGREKPFLIFKNVLQLLQNITLHCHSKQSLLAFHYMVDSVPPESHTTKENIIYYIHLLPFNAAAK